jgi:hypothetical protein
MFWGGGISPYFETIFSFGVVFHQLKNIFSTFFHKPCHQ